jgi:mevalonate kinase
MGSEISCSAPGKAILAGEHAVVHGYPSIVGAIDLRTRATMRTGLDTFSIDLPDVGTNIQAAALDEFLSSCEEKYPLFNRIYEAVLNPGLNGDISIPYGREVEGFSITITSAVPVSAGLGSSAGLCACLVKLLLIWRGIELDERHFFALSKHAEEFFHSHPSGIDTTAAINGGVFLFQHGEIKAQINRQDELDGDLIVVNTGVARNTGHMVDFVHERYKKDPGYIGSLFVAIQSVVEELWSSIEAGTLTIQQLGSLFSKNQAALEAIGVSIPEIDEILEVAISSGATGGKLTGAGGGGCVLVVCPRESTGEIVRAIQEAGYATYQARFSETGFEVHVGAEGE